MPKFFIDQNISHDLIRPLGAAFRESQFKAARNEQLHDVPDLELFPTLHAQGYDGIITADTNQLQDDEEREGLRVSALHFIGVTYPPKRGREQFVILASSLILGLHHVLADWRDEPTAYLIDHRPLLQKVLAAPESL